jgi:hypothetical protein
MKDINNLAHNHLYTLHFSTGFFTPSEQDPFIEHVNAYRDVLKDIADTIMGINWRKLKDPSEVFDVVESQIRDVIKNLGNLGDDPVEDRIDMRNVLLLLYKILADWYSVADLSDLNDSSRYEKTGICHQNILLAIRLLTV